MKIVLVIPYRGIGDLIFHIPLIKGLSLKYNTKINILTNKVNKAKDLLKNQRFIKKIEYISFQRENQIKNSYHFYKKINSFNSDVCILTAPTKRLIIPLIISNSQKKIYFKKDSTKDLSKYIINQSKIELKNIKFIKDYSLNFNQEKIKKKNIFISIDSRHDSNDWNQIYYIELIKKILKNKSINNIYINFDPSKIKAFTSVINIFSKQKKIFFTYSTKFNKLIKIMNNCSFVIGNESGPICIGAALKKNVLSIYYPKHTNKSSKTINKKVKFFNTDIISSKKIIFNITKILQ
jgi:ADP-heptose:LPS heptosyltransferase